MTWLNLVGGGSRVRKPSLQQKPHLASAAWKSLSAASGAGPFSAQFKSKSPEHHCRGNGNELRAVQSPVLGLALFPKVRKPSLQPKQHLAKAAWNSLLAVLGSGPFSIQFKTQSPAHHCRGGGNELNSVQSPVFETWNSFLQRNTDDSSSVAL